MSDTPSRDAFQEMLREHGEHVSGGGDPYTTLRPLMECFDAFSQRVFFAELASRATPGWRLVPVEPTREMVQAGYDRLRQDLSAHQLLGVTAEREVYRAMLSASRSPQTEYETNYTRPKGIMGGPCSHCGISQPEHVGLDCDAARAKRSASVGAAWQRASKETTLNTIKDSLQRMIVSAEVFTDAEGIVTAYKIKTGALHKLIGLLELTVPVNLPEASETKER